MAAVWLTWHYIWRVLSNLILIVIVWGILLSLHSRLEILLVSILGLIYATVRGIGLGLAYALILLASGIDAEFRRLRTLLKAAPDLQEQDTIAEGDRKQFHGMMFIFHQLDWNSNYQHYVSLLSTDRSVLAGRHDSRPRRKRQEADILAAPARMLNRRALVAALGWAS